MKRRWFFLLVLLLLGLTAAWLWREARLEKKFVDQMLVAATRYGVDPLLVEQMAVPYLIETHHQFRTLGTHG